MKHLLLRAALLAGIIAMPNLAQSQYLVSSENLSTTSAALLGFFGSDIPTLYDVNYYKLTYNTVNTAGEPTVASGGVAIPATESCNSFPLAAYCHGTVLRQLDAPSQENFESIIVKLLSSSGFIAVAPDYLGLGENPGIHPYIHAESEATATIDLIRATREFLESQPNIEDNGEVFITGYSQGGQGAMATLQYAQANGLNQELGIAGGAPCSGPYDLSGSQAEVLLSDQPYANPGYIVYLLMSYELAYGNIYNSLSDILQSPYDEEVAPYFDGAQNTYDMGTVNALLPNQISELLVDSVYTNIQTNPNHPIWVALEANDTYNWTPEVPIRMFYCTGDEQVSFHNSLTADSTMNANGAEDVASVNSQEGATHGECILPALTDAYEFFESLATSCALISGLGDYTLLNLEVYPNPATDILNINIPEQNGYLVIQDTYGRLVLEKSLKNGLNTIDISRLASGAYVVSFQFDKTIRRATIVVN